MGHGHHTHQPANYGKAFAIGIGLNILFVAVEVVYGFSANSSALLADAGHNASDVLSLMFAWGAMWLAKRKPTNKYTYGLRRTTILVSILNALLIFGAVVAIGWEAVGKLGHPEAVAGNTIMIVAAIGIGINTATALLFMKGQKGDLNIRGAFLHMAADAGVSAGVVIAGLLIKLTGANWIDPAISFLIIIVIIWSAWRLFIDSINLALDAVPKDIDLEKVKNFLLSMQGVKEVHDLHVWAMSTTEIALTTHLVMPAGHTDEFIFSLRRQLHDTFGIEHTTVQIEKTFEDNQCRDSCIP